MDTFYRIVALLGGLAMFLYGMRLMGDGLKSSSSAVLRSTLEKVTSNRLIGFLFGVIVTCVIQSSTATIVLTVGLVGAGFLKFRQSIGIVLGANVGTAITAQIIRLMDVQAGSNSILFFFKSDNLAPMALIIGIILIMFFKDKSKQSAGTIFVGFGILFVGLMNMSAAVATMSESLSKLLVSFENNYFLGFLAGVGVTAIIQSSSAVVGIIQSIASSVGVSMQAIFAVIIGVNIGDCLTTFLVCRIGAKPDQVRTCLVHIIYNVFAAAMLFVGIAIFRKAGIISDQLWTMPLDAGGVANLHGLFRIIPAVALLPFVNVFAAIAEKMVPDAPQDPEDAVIEKSLRELDVRLLENPGLALDTTSKLVGHMSDVSLKNFRNAATLLDKPDDKVYQKIQSREELLDRMADASSRYLVELSSHIVLENDTREQSFQLKALGCFERIGDLASHMADDLYNLSKSDTEFSESARKQLRVAIKAAGDVLELSVHAYKSNSNT
ncbi:MAG: Na/Pi cotransporter family protein, partial [Eubacterium sp.]|nr:Na/Pi cotransporter family protein [Eubacterium sp.]